jgi:hypothetical protein
MNWFNPQIHTGWEKDMPLEKRRDLVLKAHKGNYLASARSMQALANVTTDMETKKQAAIDADYFFTENSKIQYVHPGKKIRNREVYREKKNKILGFIPRL